MTTASSQNPHWNASPAGDVQRTEDGGLRIPLHAVIEGKPVLLALTLDADQAAVHQAQIHRHLNQHRYNGQPWAMTEAAQRENQQGQLFPIGGLNRDHPH
ncbi:hypothetical protein ACWGQT_00335 [Streptomyces yangpuensis]